MGSLGVAPHLAVERHHVADVTCAACARRVIAALLEVPGVRRAEVDLAGRTVEVERDPAVATPQHLRGALAKAGYAVSSGATGPEGASARMAVGARTFLGGALGAAALLGLYLALAGIAQGWEHALALLAADAPFVGAIALGFGVQVGLFVHLRGLHARASAKPLAATGGASTASMLACCAHHLVDVAPALGIAGLATLLGTYKVPLLWLGMATNLAGITYVVSRIRRCQAGLAAAPSRRPQTSPACHSRGSAGASESTIEESL